jgi:hypothetical protein
VNDPAPSARRRSPPPLLGSWRNLYWLLFGELALLVAGFYALSRWAS